MILGGLTEWQPRGQQAGAVTPVVKPVALGAKYSPPDAYLIRARFASLLSLSSVPLFRVAIVVESSVATLIDEIRN